MKRISVFQLRSRKSALEEGVFNLAFSAMDGDGQCKWAEVFDNHTWQCHHKLLGNYSEIVRKKHKIKPEHAIGDYSKSVSIP